MREWVPRITKADVDRIYGEEIPGEVSAMLKDITLSSAEQWFHLYKMAEHFGRITVSVKTVS